MKLENMSSEERSLLLYLETRAVDHGGLVDTRHMNQEDMAIAKKFNDTGFLSFGRVNSKSLKNTGLCSHWCELSEEAWTLAHAERRARNVRMMEKRKWRKTKEKDE